MIYHISIDIALCAHDSWINCKVLNIKKNIQKKTNKQKLILNHLSARRHKRDLNYNLPTFFLFSTQIPNSGLFRMDTHMQSCQNAHIGEYPCKHIRLRLT